MAERRGGRGRLGVALGAVLAIGVAVGGPGARAASIQPTGVTRHVVRALAGTNDAGAVVESELFEDTLATAPFDDGVEVAESIPGAGASGGASLRSVLGPDRIEAAGAVEASAWASGTLLAAGIGDALFRFEFTVDAPTPYDLSVTLEGAGEQDPFVEVSFLGDGSGPLYALSGPGQEGFSQSGVLVPGTIYFLSAVVLVTADAGGIDAPVSESVSGAFTLSLVVPEPAAGLLFLLGGLATGQSRRRRRAIRP